MTKDDLPFEGVKVLDLSQGVAGPYCGMHLARNGADVIKVEPTEIGCWSRRLGKHTGDQTANFVIVDNAKRSRAINRKAAPERCEWGSDWPHPGTKIPPDDAVLFDLMSVWGPDEAVRVPHTWERGRLVRKEAPESACAPSGRDARAPSG